MSWFTKCGCLLVGSLVIFTNLPAQSDDVGYRPLNTYSENSMQLIKALKAQRDEEIGKIQVPNKSLIGRVYSERTDRLISQLKKGAFIDNDTIQEFVDRVMGRILQHNNVNNKPKQILIIRDHNANAYCYGEGTFIVTIGLLSRIRSESQLAFALSHEVAHYELNHVTDKIVRVIEKDLAKKARKEFSKILTEEINLEDIESLRQLIYGESQFSREAEWQADSLGFVYFTTAGYKQTEAISLLSLLDHKVGDSGKGSNLFTPFHSSKYPFNELWLKPRLSIYHKKPTSGFILSYDSIDTHPDIEKRRSRIESKMTDDRAESNEVKEVIHHLAQFESVEGAYFFRQYDHCIYLALTLLNENPHNAYLVSMISKTLIELMEAKSNSTFSNYVSLYTINYGDDLRLVNNFLYNLMEEEMGEVAYNFLNNKSNFKVENEEHYYLLWKICGLTQRPEVQKRVKDSYSEKFGKGNYYNRMN